MKIAIVVPYFPPKVGGTETATQRLATHLAMRGHAVTVITAMEGDLPEERVENGFTVCLIRGNPSSLPGALNFCFRTLAVLKRTDPDIVHAQSILRNGIACFLGKVLLHKKYVTYCRGGDVYDPWFLKGPVSRLVLDNAGVRIALTEDMKSAMRAMTKKEVIVIPNGIDIQDAKISRDAARARLGMPPGEKIIIFVGRLHPDKGLKYLIDAFAQVVREYPPAKLYIVGDGPEKQSLEAQASGSGVGNGIVFTGAVENEKVPLYLVAADVFVLPSVSEGFPVAMLEAMAAGLPVVTTDVRGLTEIVKDGENGLVVGPRNPDAIADRLLTLMRDDALRAVMSGNNREKAGEYSWENVALQVENAYATARCRDR